MRGSVNGLISTLSETFTARVTALALDPRFPAAAAWAARAVAAAAAKLDADARSTTAGDAAAVAALTAARAEAARASGRVPRDCSHFPICEADGDDDNSSTRLITSETTAAVVAADTDPSATATVCGVPVNATTGEPERPSKPAMPLQAQAALALGLIARALAPTTTPDPALTAQLPGFCLTGAEFARAVGGFALAPAGAATDAALSVSGFSGTVFSLCALSPAALRTLKITLEHGPFAAHNELAAHAHAHTRAQRQAQSNAAARASASSAHGIFV